MQGILAIVSAIAGVGTWLQGASWVWLAGAALIFAVVPFTLIAIMPTNRKLLNPKLDRASDGARRLLEHWGTLHAFRSALSFIAAVIFVASLIWR
jgi:hypothetical protein